MFTGQKSVIRVVPNLAPVVFVALAACGGQSITTTSNLIVEIQGEGHVTSQPGGIDCPGDCTERFISETSLTLTASPNAGFQFSQWLGDCEGSAATITIMVDKLLTCTAVFVAHPARAPGRRAGSRPGDQRARRPGLPHGLCGTIQPGHCR